MARRNIGRIIRRFKTAVTVERREGGSFVKGRFVAPTDFTTFSPTVSAQPMDADEMLLLPEGLRTRAAIKVYSQEELRVADAPNGELADVVLFQGERWEVHQVEDWQEQGDFFKAICVKEGQ